MQPVPQFTLNCMNCTTDPHGDATGPLQLQEVVAIAQDILEGLVQLHGLHVLHLNLNPENVLLDDLGHAYVPYFGTAQDFEADSAAPSTPDYM